jgi:transposase-like protein
MSRLSVEDRWRVIALMKQSKGDCKYTARHVPCHIKAVRRWWQRYLDTDGVDDAKRVGRPRAIPKRSETTTLNLLMNEHINGAAHVAKELAVNGATKSVVHKATVIRAARRAALQRGKKLAVKRGPPPKGMRQATKLKRSKFAKTNLKRDWGNVLFTDRKRFYLHYPGSKVKPVRWTFQGQEENEAVFQPTNPQCLNVYAGISPYGMTALHVVAGTSKTKTNHKTKTGRPARNITRSEYQEVLNSTLLPEGTRLFGEKGVKAWYLQQDNDPSHGVVGTVLQEWNLTHAGVVQLLPNWPPSSPDLSIIENVWAWVQQEVNKLGCKDFEEFKQAVAKTIAAIPQDMSMNLFNSLKARMQLVVEKMVVIPSTELSSCKSLLQQGVAKVVSLAFKVIT